MKDMKDMKDMTDMKDKKWIGHEGHEGQGVNWTWRTRSESDIKDLKDKE